MKASTVCSLWAKNSRYVRWDYHFFWVKCISEGQKKGLTKFQLELILEKYFMRFFLFQKICNKMKKILKWLLMIRSHWNCVCVLHIPLEKVHKFEKNLFWIWACSYQHQKNPSNFKNKFTPIWGIFSTRICCCHSSRKKYQQWLIDPLVVVSLKLQTVESNVPWKSIICIIFTQITYIFHSIENILEPHS